MCSTTKPKRSSQGKALASSTSILATMNSTQRQAFAERANEASDRRVSQLKAMHPRKQEPHNSTKASQLKRDSLRTHQNRVKKTWLYWLLSAYLMNVMKKIIKH